MSHQVFARVPVHVTPASARSAQDAVPTQTEFQDSSEHPALKRTAFHGIWGLPYISGAFFGVRMMRIVMYWGLFWGPPVL